MMKLNNAYFIICLIMMGSCLEAQELLYEEKFDAEGIRKVELEGSFVDVNVDGISGDRVTFDGRIEGPARYKGDISIASRLDGEVLKIWIERSKGSYNNLRGRLDLGVPKGVELDVSSSSGDLNARNIESRVIRLSCSSGNIEASQLTGQDLWLKTSSGNISAFRLEGNLIVKASSGNIDIDNITGDIECKASSGNIKIKNAGKSAISGEASSGNIYLEDISGNFDLHCSSGNIRGSDISVTADSRFDTTSGTISIDVTNELDELSFDLRANSGRVSAGSRRGKDGRLLINNGKFKISARTTSGDINID